MLFNGLLSARLLRLAAMIFVAVCLVTTLPNSHGPMQPDVVRHSPVQSIVAEPDTHPPQLPRPSPSPAIPSVASVASRSQTVPDPCSYLKRPAHQVPRGVWGSALYAPGDRLMPQPTVTAVGCLGITYDFVIGDRAETNLKELVQLAVWAAPRGITVRPVLLSATEAPSRRYCRADRYGRYHGNYAGKGGWADVLIALMKQYPAIGDVLMDDASHALANSRCRSTGVMTAGVINAMAVKFAAVGRLLIPVMYYGEFAATYRAIARYCPVVALPYNVLGGRTLPRWLANVVKVPGVKFEVLVYYGPYHQRIQSRSAAIRQELEVVTAAARYRGRFVRVTAFKQPLTAPSSKG